MGQSLSDSVHNSQPLKREGRQPGWNQGPCAWLGRGGQGAGCVGVLAGGGGGGEGGVCVWGGGGEPAIFSSKYIKRLKEG